MDFQQLNKIRTGLRRRIKAYVSYDRYLTLRLETQGIPSTKHEKLHFEVLDDALVIEDVYKRSGRAYQGINWRINNRLAKGLKFYACYENNKLVASLWIIHNSARFLDEAAVHFLPNDRFIWLRDVFILESYRGSNRFTEIVFSLWRKYYADSACHIYSDTEKVNIASVKAHQKCGFETVSMLSRLVIFKHLIFRFSAKSSIDTVWFKPKSKLIIKNAHFKHYTQTHVA